MLKAYKKYWKKAFQIQGYSNRPDYWWVFLVNAIIFAILRIASMFASLPAMAKIVKESGNLSQSQIVAKSHDLLGHPSGAVITISVIIFIVGLLILVPNVSLIARRLRDAGMPWWIAILFGISALYSLLANVMSFKALVPLGLIFSLITLVTYVLCLFPSKYRDDEDDDSRNYD